jgi:hypothetical protein
MRPPQTHGYNERRAEGRQALAPAEQLPETGAGLVKVDLGEDGARALDLLGGGEDLGAAADDHLALLARAAAIESNPVPLRVLAGDRHRDGNRVPRATGLRNSSVWPR